jgi:hypothetical protein
MENSFLFPSFHSSFSSSLTLSCEREKKSEGKSQERRQKMIIEFNRWLGFVYTWRGGEDAK